MRTQFLVGTGTRTERDCRQVGNWCAWTNLPWRRKMDRSSGWLPVDFTAGRRWLWRSQSWAAEFWVWTDCGWLAQCREPTGATL